MQTFITDYDFDYNFVNLDSKRLGKQRVEAVQILSCLIEKPTKWINHPAVMMWRGYEKSLFLYFRKCCHEWVTRGYRNEKCNDHIQRFEEIIMSNPKYLDQPNEPYWMTNRLIHSHRANLFRKDQDFYAIKFRQNNFTSTDDVPYVWPVQKHPEISRIIQSDFQFADRDFLKVTFKDGSVQPFYRSSGRNSGKGGMWFPFDGVRPLNWRNKIWFDKEKYCGEYCESLEIERYGTWKLWHLCHYLYYLQLPKAHEEAKNHTKINTWLDTGRSLSYNLKYYNEEITR